MTFDAIFRQNDEQQDYTPAAAEIAGWITQTPDGRAAVLKADTAAAALGAVFTEGIFDVSAATGTLFSAGEGVWWDDTNNLAVNAGAATASFLLGPAVAAKVSGVLVVRVDLNGALSVMKGTVATAASAAVSNSTTETVVGTYTIPANQLKKGMVIEFFAALIATLTNSTDTFQFRVRLGGLSGTVVADSTAIDLANNDVGVLRGEIVFRSDGATGAWVSGAMAMLKTTATPTLASGTLDTTAAETLVVTIVESAASAGDSARCDVFNAYLR